LFAGLSSYAAFNLTLLTLESLTFFLANQRS
jgi:hypothetical protein